MVSRPPEAHDLMANKSPYHNAVIRYQAAHDEWREANVAESEARAALSFAEERRAKAQDLIQAATTAVLCAALDGLIVDVKAVSDE